MQYDELYYPEVINETPIVYRNGDSCLYPNVERRLAMPMINSPLFLRPKRRIIPVYKELPVKHYAKPLKATEHPEQCHREQKHRSKSLNRGTKNQVKFIRMADKTDLDILPPIMFVVLGTNQ